MSRRRRRRREHTVTVGNCGVASHVCACNHSLETNISSQGTIKDLGSRDKGKSLGHFLLVAAFVITVEQVVRNGGRRRTLLLSRRRSKS